MPDRQTDMTKLKDAFSEYANAPQYTIRVPPEHIPVLQFPPPLVSFKLHILIENSKFPTTAFIAALTAGNLRVAL